MQNVQKCKMCKDIILFLKKHSKKQEESVIFVQFCIYQSNIACVPTFPAFRNSAFSYTSVEMYLIHLGNCPWKSVKQ